MIDYYSYKKIYTGGDMFTLSGRDFVGLAQYAGDEAIDVVSGDVLIGKNTYDTDLFKSNVFRDRVIDDIGIPLPIDISECYFGLNETFNFKTLKFKLDNLRANNTFVYSRLFIASNNLPFAETITYAGLELADSVDFTVYTVGKLTEQINQTVDFIDSNNYKSLGDVFDTTAQVNYDDSGRFALFCVSSSSFVSITGSDVAFDVIESSSLYDSSTANDFTFKEIGGITSNKDSMFISDKGNNTVIKYDITGYLNNDTALRNRRYLQGVVGGEGNVDRRTNFIDPTVLTCNDRYLAIYDSGNKCIKLFTVFLEYVTTFTILNLRKERLGIETFNTMEFDPDFKTLYVITTEDTGDVILYRIDVDTRKLERVAMNENIGNGRVNSIAFSQVDSNYWQFCTDTTIYKKYKTRPQDNGVGYYTESNLFEPFKTIPGSSIIINKWDLQTTGWGNSNFLWNLDLGEDVEGGIVRDYTLGKFRGLSVVRGEGGNDKIVVFGKSRVYYFSEPTPTSYQRVLKSFNRINYGISGFSLSPDEYVQPPVINSEIYKVVYDLLLLKNSLVGRFASRVDDGGNAILQDYNYNIDLSELREDNIENYFIHHNEENIVGAINRVFGEIYNLQTKLINLIQVDTGSDIQGSGRYVDSSDPSCRVLVSSLGNLSISKSVQTTAEVYGEGDTVTYSVSLSNTGGKVVGGVTLTDSLSGIFNKDDALGITTNRVDVSPGQVITVTYDYIVTGADANLGSLINTAIANSSDIGDITSTVAVSCSI